MVERAGGVSSGSDHQTTPTAQFLSLKIREMFMSEYSAKDYLYNVIDFATLISDVHQ